MKTKVCHLTSVHRRYDTRIFIKQCSSLAKLEDYDVSLVVADGKSDEIKNGVKIYDVGKPLNRITRIFLSTKRVFDKALKLNSDIYHLHDPELIPTGLILKKQGKKVIFDSHEDVPKQLLGKPYMNKLMLWFLSISFSLFEKFSCGYFDFIICATPSIKEKFNKINIYTIDINNYPILNELSNNYTWKKKKNEICYVGGLSKNRGIIELVNSLVKTPNIRLNLAGSFNEKVFETEVRSLNGWGSVNEFGYVDRKKIQDIFSKSKAGLVTLHPIINYLDALPVKMFEYMAAGLPVISSNISLWEKIIHENNCGICVNPKNPDEISKAINYIIKNPKIAQQMGENGRNAIINKFNWAIEEKKLFQLYENL